MPDPATDAELAEHCRVRLAEKANEMLEVLHDIRLKGFVGQFAIGLGPMGREQITHLAIVKEYK